MPITATTAQCQRLDTRGVHFTTWMVYLWCMFNLEFSNLQLFHFDTLSFGGTQWGRFRCSGYTAEGSSSTFEDVQQAWQQSRHGPSDERGMGNHTPGFTVGFATIAGAI